MKKEYINLVPCGSQHGQSDLIGNILYRRKPGFYVDVGARCGEFISNTFYLEKMGWKGICIEPHPDLFQKCKRSRKSLCFNCAASSSKGTLNFAKMEEDPIGNSGVVETLPSTRLESMEHKIIQVPSRTLTSMLDEAKAPHTIQYLDIDTEGHEIEVLKGIDFNKYKFDYIGIEAEYGTDKYFYIEKLIHQQKEYSLFCTLGSDCFFSRF